MASASPDQFKSPADLQRWYEASLMPEMPQTGQQPSPVTAVNISSAESTSATLVIPTTMYLMVAFWIWLYIIKHCVDVTLHEYTVKFNWLYDLAV